MLDTRIITQDQAKYYKTLFSNFDKYIEIRLIKEGKETKQLFLTYEELLEYQPPNDVNVYVGMYERDNKFKGDKESCTKTNVIYLDFDDEDETEDSIRFKIDIKKIPQPTMIINSGHGFHVYWLLEEPAKHELNPIIKGLQKALNADPKSTDIARILRIPDTMNVKDDPVPCKLVYFNDNKSTISQFEDVLKIKRDQSIYEKIKINKNPIKELLDVKYNGLNNMASGVSKGERNFCTGRITQTLKKLNYTKQETQDIIFRWNTLNKPKKDTEELKQDILTFWTDKRYKYDGRAFSKENLQKLNNKFIDDETIFFSGNNEDAYSYDNELLKPKIFQSTKGLTFAVLSIIMLAEDDGLSRAHLADLAKRDITDKTLRESLSLLEDLKYIETFKRGRSNFYKYTRKNNYKRGYTKTDDILQKMYVYGGLTDPEYKLMILIEKYAHNNKRHITTGTELLAYGMGLTERTIVRNLSQLEYKQFIKREIIHGKRTIRIIYR